jgi:septation ring formation regulator
MLINYSTTEFLKSPTFLIILILVGLLILLVLFLILFRFVVLPNKLRKNVHELERRFDYLQALLNGQDVQCVKRLEIISRTNLLYSEKYSDYNKRLKDIRNRYYIVSQDSMNNLRDLMLAKKYKSSKEAYLQAKTTVADFEEKLNKFSDELMSVIKPEEDAKQLILNPKDKYRNIKNQYHEMEDELDFLNASYSKIFDAIDNQLATYDGFVESAHYEECEAMLPNLIKMINELEVDLKISPNLCASINTLIPSRLRQLKRTYNELSDDGYPLNHLMVKTFLDNSDLQINQIKARMQAFDFANIQNVIDTILSSIEKYFGEFNKEKEAKIVFDNECNSTYSDVNATEKRFIKLCNILPDITKIYQISKENLAKLEDIRSDVNNAIGVKRTLDTYIHSYSKQPYTILVKKMHELRDTNADIVEKLDEYQTFIASLKNDTEDAHNLLLAFYNRTKKAEKILHDSGLDSFQNKYVDAIAAIYSNLDTMNKTLCALPIDVDKINEIVKILNTNGETSLSKIEQDNNMMQLVEATILYANRERGRFSNVDELVNQAETLYYQADFEKAYIEAGDALRIAKSATSTEGNK